MTCLRWESRLGDRRLRRVALARTITATSLAPLLHWTTTFPQYRFLTSSVSKRSGSKIRSHPLFPLLIEVVRLCKLGFALPDAKFLQTCDCMIDEFVLQARRNNTRLLSDDHQVNALLVRGIQVYRLHLAEIERHLLRNEAFSERHVLPLRRVCDSGAVPPGLTHTGLSSEASSPRLESSAESTPSKNGKKSRGNHPKSATACLKGWLFDHLVHPYPTEQQRDELCLQTGLSKLQISNWFVNARRRILQPMMDAMRAQGKTLEECDAQLLAQSVEASMMGEC